MNMFNISNSFQTSVTTLYNEIQSVLLKVKSKDDLCKKLRITVSQQSTGSLINGNVLNVQVTEDEDTYFIYSLQLTYDDFKTLKNQQGLQIDYENFPYELIKLLELCKNPSQPSFILVLGGEDDTFPANSSNYQTSDVFLKVIETNHFKNICYLSLKVSPGSDDDIKAHMSNKIKELSENLNKQIKISSNQEHQVRELAKQLEMRTKDFNELQLKLNEEKSNLKLETHTQLSEEREKIARLELECQQRVEREKCSLELRHQSVVKDLNEQINSLIFNNKNLYESKCQLELSLKEKSLEISRLDNQMLQLNSDSTNWKKQLSNLDQDVNRKEKLLSALNTKLAVYEQETKDKETLINKLQELLRVSNEKKSQLEDSLRDRELSYQKQVVEIDNCKSDLVKANEIISRFHTDLAITKNKLKKRTDIALEQEKVIEEKLMIEMKLVENVKKLEVELQKTRVELNKVQLLLEETKTNLEVKEEEMNRKEKAIQWLHSELNTYRSQTEPDHSKPGYVTTRSHEMARDWSNSLHVKSQQSTSRTGVDSAYLSSRVAVSSNMADPVTSSTPAEQAADCLKSRLGHHFEEKNNNCDSNNGHVQQPAKSVGIDPKYYNPSINLESKSRPNSAGSRTSTKCNKQPRPQISTYFSNRPA